MSNFISRTLATGNSKHYYNVEKEFEAVGTFYTDSSMHYTASHPSLGLWLCGITQSNSPIPIGFVQWNNIKRIIVDNKNEQVFVVLYNYDEVINNADFQFRKIYKGAFTHTISSGQNEEKSVKLPLNLFSGNVLPCLQQRCTIVYEEVRGAESIWPIVFIVGLFIIIAISLFA
jgi:hypothetical protein